MKRGLEKTMAKNEEESARLHEFYESRIKSMQDTFQTTMGTFTRQLDEQLSWQTQQAEEVSAFAEQMWVFLRAERARDSLFRGEECIGMTGVSVVPFPLFPRPAALLCSALPPHPPPCPSRQLNPIPNNIHAVKRSNEKPKRALPRRSLR